MDLVVRWVSCWLPADPTGCCSTSRWPRSVCAESDILTWNGGKAGLSRSTPRSFCWPLEQIGTAVIQTLSYKPYGTNRHAVVFEKHPRPNLEGTPQFGLDPSGSVAWRRIPSATNQPCLPTCIECLATASISPSSGFENHQARARGRRPDIRTTRCTRYSLSQLDGGPPALDGADQRWLVP